MAIPVTGLSQLGDQLLRASGDYANIKLRKQSEAEQRAQALADLADQRRYSEGRQDIERGNRMTDTAQLAQMNQRFEALQRAQQLGLIAVTDIGKIEVENLALGELAKREAAEAARKTQMRERAQSRVDAIAKKLSILQDEIMADEMVEKIRPQVSETELKKEMQRLALLANPEIKDIMKMPKELIEGQRNAALTAANAKLAEEWMMNVQDAKARAANNKLLFRSLMDENNQLLQAYGTVGDIPTMLADPASLPGPSGVIPNPAKRPTEDFIPPPPDIPPQATQSSANQYPVTSLMGLAERAPPIQDVLAAPGMAIDAIGRYGGAGLQGLLSGDFSVPETGPVTMAGNKLGSMFAGPVQGPVDPVQVARTQWLQNAWRDPSNPPKPLGPLQNLDSNGQYKQLVRRPPTSVFSYPDPYGSLMGP